MLESGTITITALAAGRGNNGIHVLFRNCAPFTDCMSEISNSQIDNAKNIDVVMPMYSLTEYSDNYSETSGSLWQYYKDETALNDNDLIINFPGNSALFKFKQKITGSTGYDNTKTVKIMATTFAITDTKPYFSVVTLSTEDSAKLLQQLKVTFIKTKK